MDALLLAFCSEQTRWDWDLNPGVLSDTCSQGRRVGPLRYPTTYALRWFDPIRTEVDWSIPREVLPSPRGEKLNLSFSALPGNRPDHPQTRRFGSSVVRRR